MGRSSFLFAEPSFIGGLSSVLDIGNTLTVYNDSKSPSEADMRAIRSDWVVVGEDLRHAMEQWENERIDG